MERMKRQKRRPSFMSRRNEECTCPNCSRLPEEPYPMYRESELLPIKKEEYKIPKGSLSMAVRNMYDFRDLLKKAWCKETAYQASLKSGRQVPSRGQCYVTALLVQEWFGGEIMTGIVKGEEHYWNMINEVEIDFTSDQYGGDGYHPVLGSKGVIAKPNKGNKRFKILMKKWEKICLENETLMMTF